MKKTFRMMCAVMAGLALAASAMAVPVAAASGDVTVDQVKVSVHSGVATAQPVLASTDVAPVGQLLVRAGNVIPGWPPKHADLDWHGPTHRSLASVPRPPNESPHSG